MKLLHLWPLWLLLLIPVIIIFWLLKQKAYDHPFSSVLLWQEAWKNQDKATPWERLKHNLLMYLQILAVLVLVFAMTSPYIPSKQVDSDRVILAIDVSGSMNALMDIDSADDQTRFDSAIKQACDYVRSMPEDSWISVVSMGANTKVELSGTQDKNKVYNILENLKCTEMACTHEENLQFLSALTATQDASVVIFSDTPMNLSEGFYQVVVDSDGVNVSVDWVSYRITDNGMEVMAWIANRSDEDFVGELDICVDDTLKDILNIDVAAGEALGFSTVIKSGYEDASYVSASIHERDLLLQDNSAYEILDVTGQKRVLYVGDGNTFLENALASIDNFEIYKADAVPKDSDYDIYIFDGILPEEEWTSDASSVIYINPPRTEDSNENSHDNVWLDFNDTKLSKYIYPWKFAVKTCESFEVPLWATSLIETNNGECVSYYGILDGHFQAVIGFDFFDTDFALQTNFPIFIHNLMLMASDQSLTSVKSVQAGESVTLYVDDESDISVKSPKGETFELSARQDSIVLEQSGLYTFFGDKDGENVFSYIWSYFPTETEFLMESDVTLSDSSVIGNVDNPTEGTAAGYNLKNILIIAGMLIIIVEAIVFLKQRPRYRRLTMVCHGIALLCLIFALLNIQLRQASREIETVYVVDASNSMGSYKNDASGFVREAVQAMPKDNYAGVVAFGDNALVVQFMTESKVFDKLQSRPVSSATNLENALLTAMTMLDDNKAKRIVLLTDGKQNQGNVLNTLDSLLENDIMLDVVYYNEDQGNEIYVDSLTVPESIHVGDTFSIETNIISTSKTQAVVYLYNGRDLKLTQEVSLNAGNNRFVFNDIQEDTGLSQYRIRVTSDGASDSQSVNNEYYAYTTVNTSPKVLVIEGEAGKASEFEKVLDAANINYHTVTANGVPETMAQLLEYKSVITVDVYVDDLKDEFLNCLDSYVKDYGGGFIATGGENSFALGGYRDTVLEDILPVYMDMEGEKEIPTMSMVMVIDHSGSMSDGDGRTTNLDLAKTAAISALDNLRETDRLGVLGFSDSFSWYVPLETLGDGTKASEGIYSIPLSGGTSIYPALKEAIESLEAEESQIRHVLLLTDGQDGFRDYDELLEKANNLGITVSTVSIGDGADVHMLEDLANGGNGRYYHATLNTDLPRIFAKEVFLSTKAYLVNRDFTPIITSNHQVIRTVSADGLPTMRGYIGSKAKASATHLLVSDEDDPILTMWQYGLGKTVAFNSDVMHYWTSYYAGWENWPLLWKNIIEETFLKMDSEDSNIVVNSETGAPEVVYSTAEYSTDTVVNLVYTTPEGERFEKIMQPKRPGEYVASLDESMTGVYMLNVKQTDNGQTTFSANTAAVIPYSAEYRFGQDDRDFLRFCDYAMARRLSSVDELYDVQPEKVLAVRPLTTLFMLMGLGIFIFDILWRRIGVQIKLPQRELREIKYEKSINNDEKIKKQRKTMEKTHKSEYNKKDSGLDTQTLLKNKQNWRSGF